LDEQVHQQKENQLSFGTCDRRKPTADFIEPIESPEEPFNRIGG
jgi:hypothetical protein